MSKINKFFKSYKLHYEWTKIINIIHVDYETYRILRLKRFLAKKENGSNANAVNDCGATPLHEAVHRGDFEMCQVLLRSGADPLVRAIKRRTPSCDWQLCYSRSEMVTLDRYCRSTRQTSMLLFLTCSIRLKADKIDVQDQKYTSNEYVTFFYLFYSSLKRTRS
ncbi:unnamed protein product, partial [Trichogramma brassicae]